MENKLELWKAGLITRVRLEKKGIKYWGDTYSKPFTKLLSESARDELKTKVIKHLGQDAVREYLQGEMISFTNQRSY